MLRWLPYPFIRILLFFVTGILLGIYFSDFENYVLWGGIIGGSAGFLLSRFVFNNYFWAGIFLFSTIISIGYLHSKQRVAIDLNDFYQDYFFAVVDGYPEVKKNHTRYEAKIINTLDGDKNPSLKETRAYIYLKKPSNLNYGDIILSDKQLLEISGPKNPGEFHYANYLKSHGIYFNVFLDSTQFITVDNQPASAFIGSAYKFRSATEKIFDHYLKPTEGSVLKALVLGLRDGLDDSILNAYASAGAIHVLAVSGLHVGIIYGLFIAVFGWLRRNRKGKVLFVLTVLLGLWFYAFVTGFSPSVFRAVTMFSFIVIGQSLNRKPSIYNSIAASALILLCYDPLLLLQVGFQLSYLAVVGIVYLYPKLIALWEPDNQYLDKVWQLTCVGIAAQIATFPLALYYFHQFPTYFIISNLLVIPTATVILFSGLALISLNWVPFLASFISILVSFIIKCMNNLVIFIENLPLSIIDNIYLKNAELVVLILLVLSIIYSFTRKSFNAFYSFSLFSLLLIGSFIVKSYQYSQEELVQFYSIRGVTEIDFIKGNKAYRYISEMEKDNSYFTADFRNSRNLEKREFPQELIFKNESQSWLRWDGETYLIINAPPEDNSIISISNVLIIENESLKTSHINEHFKGKLVILGTSNRRRYVEDIVKNVTTTKVHDLNERALTLKSNYGISKE